MKSLPIKSLCIALASFLAGPLHAALECKVRGVAVERGVPGNEVYAHMADGSGTAGKITLQSFLNDESDTLSLSGPKVVFTLNADPKSAADPDESLGSCEFSGKAKSVVLLFLPEEKGSSKCRVVLVPDDAKSFPGGAFKVLNLSSQSLKITLDEDEHAFKPDEIRIIKPGAKGNQRSARMAAFTKKQDGEWTSIASSVWANPGKKRVLQLFIEDPKTEKVVIRGFRDVTEP